jgi:tape measure domain-containing protein
MADERIIRIRLDGSSARTEANKTNREIQAVGASADKASDSMGRLSSVASAVITALATTQVLAYADSWTIVNNRLRQATKTADEFNIAQRGVIEIAQRASVGVEGVATAYSRLAQATSELDLSQERLLDLTNKLTLALKAGGATAEETSSVMIQLAQGLGSGALQGDELKSIMEASIPITKALAKEFGVTVGELKTLGSEGKITADRVVSAVENMDESALKFTKTFSDGLVNIKNALTAYVGGVDESIGATKFLGESLQTVAQNVGLITDAVIALGVLFGARLVGSIASSTAAMVAYTRGALTATVQTNALGQVIARNTALMNAQALAARGASAALALIGGPAGAAFLAAAAIVYFISQAESAEERSKRLAQEVDNLKTKYLDLNEAQRRIEIAKLNTQFKELQAELSAANKKLNQFKGFTDSPVKSEGVRQYTAEVERLNFELEKVSQKQQAVFGAGIDKVNFTDATNQTTAKNSASVDNSDFESRLQSERLITQALQDEVELRQALRLGEVNQRQFDEQNALNQVFYAYEQKRQAIIENETLNEEQRKQILDLYREQEILAEQQKLDAITSATQASTDERLAMQEAYNQSVQALQLQTFSNATALLSSLSAESKIAALAGIAIQTATAFIANKAATASAATLAYSSQLIPGDPTSPIRAAAAAAKATTLGTVNGALILAAGGAKAIGALGGGGGGSPATGGSSGSSGSQFTPQRSQINQPQQQQRRIIDLRGFEDGGYLTKQQLTELLQSDDDVILASNNGQSNAQRTGLING